MVCGLEFGQDRVIDGEALQFFLKLDIMLTAVGETVAGNLGLEWVGSRLGMLWSQKTCQIMHPILGESHLALYH